MLTKIGDTVEKIFAAFVGASAAICLIVANLAVFARVIRLSTPWSEEVLRILFVIIIYIGTALAYRSNGLIGITMLEESLIGKANNIPYKALKIVQHVICTGFAILCAFQGVRMAQIQMMNNELTPAMEIPAAVSTVGLVVGTIIWSFYGIGKIIEVIKLQDIKKEVD